MSSDPLSHPKNGEILHLDKLKKLDGNRDRVRSLHVTRKPRLGPYRGHHGNSKKPFKQRLKDSCGGPLRCNRYIPIYSFISSSLLHLFFISSSSLHLFISSSPLHLFHFFFISSSSLHLLISSCPLHLLISSCPLHLFISSSSLHFFFLLSSLHLFTCMLTHSLASLVRCWQVDTQTNNGLRLHSILP